MKAKDFTIVRSSEQVTPTYRTVCFRCTKADGTEIMMSWRGLPAQAPETMAQLLKDLEAMEQQKEMTPTRG